MLIPRTEPLVLPPVPRWEWREPSAAQDKDQFGNANFVGFRFRAINPDGRVAWQGCTRSREDADAFLFALIEGTLDLQPGLWDLPWPAWHPDIAPFAYIQYAAVSVLVTPLDTLTALTIPVDWVDAGSLLIACGAGGSGGAARGVATDRASGGGAGAFVSTASYPWSNDPTELLYAIASGAAGVTRSTTGRTAGNSAANDSAIYGTEFPTSKITAGSGQGGKAVATGAACAGGAGGVGSSGVGLTISAHTGGRGGNVASDGSCAGGGGAAGDTGAGNQGVDTTGTSQATNGGSGGTVSAGSAGAGSAGVTSSGTATSSAGGTGSGLYNDGVTSVGPGGGSGAARTTGASSTATSGSGGPYGGGSGGALKTTSTSGSAVSGAGNQGFVALVWTPAGGGPLIRGGSLTKGGLIRGGRLVSAPRDYVPGWRMAA